MTEETFTLRLRRAEAEAHQLAAGHGGVVSDLERALEHLRAHARGVYEAGDVVGISEAARALVEIEHALVATTEQQRSEHGPRRPLRQGQDD